MYKEDALKEHQQYNYDRIAMAIDYIKDNFKLQPSLKELANVVNLSPFHFQRLFLEWAGITPKKFLQFVSIEHAKSLLKDQATLADVAFETGLSGTGRLHDLFVNIEGMTPANFKNGGESLPINYSFENSPFGKIIIAATPKGICHLSFYNHKSEALEALKSQFPNAIFTETSDDLQANALHIFQNKNPQLDQIKLHLKGSDFQMKVWEALLKIPSGTLITYYDLATKLGNHNLTQEVGLAMQNNPVAYLIPCHRVIGRTGKLGGYMWGETRKTAIIAWESACS